MPLSKNSDRIVKSHCIKKVNAEQLKKIAKSENRNPSQQLDVIIEYYVEQFGITKSVNAETQSKLNGVFKGDMK